MMGFDAWNGNYQPGLWQQDLVTLPLQGALVFAMNKTYTKTAHPLVPFQADVFPGGRNPTQHSKTFLVPLGLGWGLGVFGGLKAALPERVQLYPALSGLAHTHLITEILTSFAKLSFQRPRPFLEAEQKKGREIRDDDRLSFFSGHSSHVFAFSAYTSVLVWQTTQNRVVGSLYTLIAASAASWIGSSRAIRGQHNWSDVIVGGIVGSAAGTWVRLRTEATEENLRAAEAQNSKLQGEQKSGRNFATEKLPWSFSPVYSPSENSLGLQFVKAL